MEDNQSEYDFLNLYKDKYFKKNIVREEIIQFSDKIIKINKYGFKQERNLLITDKAIYNLKKTVLKRRIDFKIIEGITVSKISDEFVIHCKDIDYDYQFVSPRKKTIIEIIAKYYKIIQQKELPLFELNIKSLNTYVTTKKEKLKRKNSSRIPRSNSIDVEQYLFGNNSKTDVRIIDSQIEDNIILKKKTFNNTQVDINDFEKIKTIGRGWVAKVLLVKYSSNNELYAMKSMRKDQLISEGIIDNILVERNILLLNQSPFLLSLSFFIQTSERIYFITPFLEGGDLFHKLKEDIFFPEDLVKFYAAQIAIAIQDLHDLGFAYRDLKPENILIDKDGYLKLCDFGASVKIKGTEKERTFAGSPEYAPPEMVCREGHTFMCDWWSFGILLYELLYGNTPFFNEDTNRMYDLIKSGAIAFPKFIRIDGKEKKYKVSEEAKDIISKLLEKDPGIRLGRKGLKEIQKHPFFNGIKFDSILKKKVKAPYIPKIDENNEFKYFDEEFLNMDVNESPVEKWLSEYENWFDRFDFIGVPEKEKKKEEEDIYEDNDDYDSDG
jgi:serum/glucocorticoid-regulated kinase 2